MRPDSQRVVAVFSVLATLAAAITIIVSQPISSPWWTYADADATYSSASLNLLRGTSIRYLDHPGLPVEELGAVVFGSEYVVDRVRGTTHSTTAFVDQRMLELGSLKTTWRTLGIALYLIGALLSWWLTARYFRSWWYGLAGGLLWVGAPDLAAESIQFRPDVALTFLVLLVTYLLGVAAARRSAELYFAAAFTIGFAAMVKLHAAGMLVALVILAIARPPLDGWSSELSTKWREFVRRRRRPLIGIAAVWLLLAILLNRDFGLGSLSGRQVLALLVPVLVVGAYLFAARRSGEALPLLRLFYGYVGVALLAGLVVPITFDVPDGLTSLIRIREGLLGGGINSGVPLFATPLHQLIEPPLRQALVVFLVAGVGAVVGLVRRDWIPVAWFASAFVLGLMAQARLATPHYFAPAYAVSIFGAVWLLREIGPRTLGFALLAGLVAYVAVPQFQHRSVPSQQRATVAREYEPQMNYVAGLLKPGQVALAPPTYPNGSDWYSYVVQPYVNYTPLYPYTFVEANKQGADEAAESGLKLAYYTGPGVPAATGDTTMQIGDIGTFHVKVLTPTVAQLLRGPGV